MATVERTKVIRYPGVLTNWSGRFLDKRILKNIRVNNIVRVVFAKRDNDQWYNTAYFRIIKQCKKDKNFFVGVCEDPYYGMLDESLIKNGQQRTFSTRHIMEIPLEWSGNENLKKEARFFNKARVITGAM